MVTVSLRTGEGGRSRCKACGHVYRAPSNGAASPTESSKKMAEADPGALSAEQESRLREWRIRVRVADEEYLRLHQELRLLLSAFVRAALLRRPHNIREFAADFFTDPTLANRIQETREWDGAEPPEDSATASTNHSAVATDGP